MALRKQRQLRSSRVLCLDDGKPITRQGAWSRVRYAAHRAKVPTGRSHPASHVLLAPGDARGSDAVGAGTGGSPGSDDDPAVFAPESGSVGRHRPVAGIESCPIRPWRNTGDGRRPREKVEALERVNWLGGRDSNPDTMVQSHVSYRWTTSQYQPGVRDRRETTIIANPNARQQAASRWHWVPPD